MVARPVRITPFVGMRQYNLPIVNMKDPALPHGHSGRFNCAWQERSPDEFTAQIFKPGSADAGRNGKASLGVSVSQFVDQPHLCQRLMLYGWKGLVSLSVSLCFSPFHNYRSLFGRLIL